MTDLKHIIGKNIKFYRKKNQLTQDKLASLIKISAPSLSSIENGNSFPSYGTLIDIIDKLNVRPYQLFISDDKEINIEDVELQSFIIEKFKRVDFDNRQIIFTIIDALSKNEN